MDKKDLFTIGEFSKITGTSIHSLRYYDEIGVLKPEYVDPLSNYRYYSFAQLSRLFAINICIDAGIKLNEFGDFETETAIDYSRLLDDSLCSIDSKIEGYMAQKAALYRLEKLVEVREMLLSGGKAEIRLDPFRAFVSPIVTGDKRDDLSAEVRRAETDSGILMRLTAKAAKHGYRISPMFFGIMEISGGESAGIYEFGMIHGGSAESGDQEGDPQLMYIPGGSYTAEITSAAASPADDHAACGNDDAGGTRTIRMIVKVFCDDPSESMNCMLTGIFPQ